MPSSCWMPPCEETPLRGEKRRTLRRRRRYYGEDALGADFVSSTQAAQTLALIEGECDELARLGQHRRRIAQLVIFGRAPAQRLPDQRGPLRPPLQRPLRRVLLRGMLASAQRAGRATHRGDAVGEALQQARPLDPLRPV